MVKLKRLKELLFEPDDYDGVTWHDVIVLSTLSLSFFTFIIFLAEKFC